MSKRLLSKQLHSTDEYSQIKMNEFLEKINDNSYFYNEISDLPLLIDSFLEDNEVGFGILEYFDQFEYIASDLFNIDHLEILKEVEDNIELKAFRLQNFGNHPDHFNFKIIAKYKCLYNEILKQILEKEVTKLQIHELLAKRNIVELMIDKPALLNIITSESNYLNFLQLCDELELTAEEFILVFEKPFVLLFNVSATYSNGKTLTLPVLMTMRREIFEIAPIVKHRIIG